MFKVLAVQTALLCWGAVCAIKDMHSKKIKNSLTVPFLFAALFYTLITGNSLLGSAASEAYTGLVFALLLSLPGFIMGRFGAGDVKMLCALAMASNSTFLLLTVIVAAISLGLWSYLTPQHYQKLPWSFRYNYPLMNPTSGSELPYAPFVFIGMLVSALHHLLTSV